MLGKSEKENKSYIRGVNLGGWLVLENFITPYLFAISECDLKGDFHYYDGQVDAPPIGSPLYKELDEAAAKKCPIIPRDKIPRDESDIVKIFRNANGGDPSIAEKYLDIHYDNLVKREDITELKEGGVTHVRVPMGHWILGDIEGDETYIEGGWKYFQRLVLWCREEGIKIWIDLHTAPGSQNGFDNSGVYNNDGPTCIGWDENATDSYLKDHNGVPPYNVRRTLRILDQITSTIVSDGMRDIVEGVGLLNEPFGNCNRIVLRDFYEKGLNIVRKNMGNSTGIYISDQFRDYDFNDGFWAGPEYKNTYLDSHFYHVFAANFRVATPRQQIALVCQSDHIYSSACCYLDGKPDPGLQRISTEFTAAFDREVGALVNDLMDHIHKNGSAFDMDRSLSIPRKNFMRNYVEAQMVNLESNAFRGWFYWNFKMEGGYCAEWDFIRGLREGWIPKLPAPDVNVAEVFGSCLDILYRTDDNSEDVVEPFPANASGVTGWYDDDVVNSHGEIMRKVFGKWRNKYTLKLEISDKWIAGFLALVVLNIVHRMRCKSQRGRYKIIPEVIKSTDNCSNLNGVKSDASV